MKRTDLVIRPDYEIHGAVQVIKDLANGGKSLEALAILNAPHLHDRRDRVSLGAL